MLGNACCRKRVGEHGSLSIGFGKLVEFTNFQGRQSAYGEWEIGTYSASWRIIQNQNTIFAKKDFSRMSFDANARLQEIDLCILHNIRAKYKNSVEVMILPEISIEFIASKHISEPMFHIFCPNNIIVQYENGSWFARRSDRPNSDDTVEIIK